MGENKMYIVLGIHHDGEILVSLDSDFEKCKSVCIDKQKSDIGEYVNFNVYKLKEGLDFSSLSIEEKDSLIVY